MNILKVLRYSAHCMPFIFAVQAKAQVRMTETSAPQTKTVSLQAPATVPANFTLILPAYDGSPNQCLATDGSGNLGWRTAAPRNSLDASDGAPANALYVDASGYVGIGTTSPGVALDVLGSIRFSSNLFLEPSASTSMSATSGSLKMIVNSSEAMRIIGTGNVGIGTTNPATKLHLDSGTMQVPVIKLSANGVNPSYLGAANALFTAGGATDLGIWSTGKLWFGTNSTSVSNMMIDNAGNVGVGTTTPMASLDVRGAIIAAAPTVTSGTTVDFGTGNLQYTSQSCAAFVLNNLKNGGTYTLAVQGTSNASACSFTAWTGVGGGTALTVKMPPDHMVPVASTHTFYSFTVLGDFVYVTWIPGY